MIRTRVYRDGKCIGHDFDPSAISDHLETHDAIVWLDLDRPDEKEMRLLADEFGLNPLAVEDALSERQRPKLDHYADHVFISLYSTRYDADAQALRSSEWAVFAAPRYLITMRKDGKATIDPVLNRWDSDGGELSKHGVGFLLWGVLDVVVDSHFAAIEDLDDAAEQAEERLFAEELGPEVQRAAYELRKSLALARRVITPTREVLNSLMRRETQLVDDAMMPYYQDVYDHVLRATEGADSLRDLISSMLETYLSLQGNRLNEIMKKLTSWAAIAAVPAVITGYYGQNVRIFPGSTTTVGGVVALLLIFGVPLALYVYFRRQDWL